MAPPLLRPPPLDPARRTLAAVVSERREGEGEGEGEERKEGVREKVEREGRRERGERKKVERDGRRGRRERGRRRGERRG